MRLSITAVHSLASQMSAKGSGLAATEAASPAFLLEKFGTQCQGPLSAGPSLPRNALRVSNKPELIIF
jgi:hypothetical protein